MIYNDDDNYDDNVWNQRSSGSSPELGRCWLFAGAHSKSRLSSKSQSCSDKPPVQSQAWIQIGIKINLEKVFEISTIFFVLILELRVSMIIRHPLQWQCIAHSIILWSNSRSFNQNKTNFSPTQGREGVVVFEAVLKLGIENLPRPAHYTFPLLRVLTLQIQIQIQIQMQIQIEIQIAKHQYQCK